MLTKLTLGEKLKDLQLAKGYKSTEHLASILNIPKTTLNDYENDEKNQDVGYANLITLAKFYEVSMDYLLGLSDVDRHLNTSYSDLGLNDKTIDLLKEPKFNIRLLNELIEHEYFADFMADMEIYIDGLATMQITTLNSVAKLAKDEITGEYAPNDKGYFIRTLQSAKIKEDRYFHAVIYEDIDRIADDLRILHSENKKDTQVVSDDTGGRSILIKLIQKLKDFKGTPQEIKLKLFTLILGTDINKLNLLPLLTAAENVAFPMDLKGVPEKVAKKRAKELLLSVGIKQEKQQQFPNKRFLLPLFRLQLFCCIRARY